MAELDTSDKLQVNVPEFPKLPTKGRLALEDRLKITRPYQEARAEMLPQMSAAEADVEKAKQAQEEIRASGKQKAISDFAEEEKGAKGILESKLEAEPLPAFIPTKDSVQDIAGLFSLISVIGMAIGGGGKMAAQRALGAMNGMLEGHRKGRMDLYKRERNEFDANFKTMMQKHQEFRKEFDDAIKLAATNKEAGLAAAELAATKAGSTVVQAMLRKGEFVRAHEFLKDLQKADENAFDFVAKQRENEIKEANAAQRHREDLAARERQHKETLASQEARAKERNATRGGGAQETALRVMQQDIGNAKYNLEDLKSLAEPTGKLPGGSVAFAQKFTGDMTSMLMRYAANQTIDEGLQGMDALMLNFAFDIASAQSGGRGQLSDAKVRAVVSQMPLDEQPESTKATKWAALMTRLEEANKSIPKEKQVEIPESLRKYYMGSRMKSESGGDIETERSNAKAAIAAGAPEDVVKQRFKQKTGQEL